MSRKINRPGLPNYGSVSDDPEVGFSGENRDIRLQCDNISTNLYTINSSTRNLQGAFSALGTERDTQDLRDQVHVWQLNANNVVKATKSDVAKLSELSRTANKVQKLQADKIINHFKEAVQGYSKIQYAVAEKLRSSLPRQPIIQDDDQSPLIEDETRQQLQLQQELQFDAELLIEREQRLKEIEGDILDVNQLMRELGALVHDQSNVVESIESNIESTRGHVESGASEIRAAAVLQNKGRKRNFILLALLVFVLSALIGIIIWSSR